MMTLVIGGSGSGKSEFAENYCMKLAKDQQKYYIATMQVYDEEGHKKVLRHQMLRAGKGFLTIEQPVDLEQASEKMNAGERAVLLECMSNLVANEMFAGTEPETEDDVVEKVVTAVKEIKEELSHLVIVSNNVFEDGKSYDPVTMAYIRAIGRINEQLARMADEVIEVVVGIPVMVKKYDR